MNPTYTHLTVILDRSGSMESIRDDTIGGFNAFLEQQKLAEGTATLTLVQFDTQDPYELIHHFKPVAEVPELTRATFVPRGSTPLLDALGRGINDLEKCLADLPEADRPAKVVLVVVTDGQENSSREFQKSQIETMIKDRSEKDDWQFVFLSADLAAIGEARGLGIGADAVLRFAKSGKGSKAAWNSLSERTTQYRSAKKAKIGFNQEDRDQSVDPDSKT